MSIVKKLTKRFVESIPSENNKATEQARSQAKVLLRGIAKGEDPQENMPRKYKMITINKLCESDLELHAKTKKIHIAMLRIRGVLKTLLNSTVGVEKYHEQKRERWLTQEEIDRLWNVLRSHRNQRVANMCRLLLLTGSRKSEVLNATWDQLDLEGGVWTKPAHATKQKRLEHLPLSSSALDLLKIMKKKSRGSKYLFPGRVPGEPIKEIKKSWAIIKN